MSKPNCGPKQRTFFVVVLALGSRTAIQRTRVRDVPQQAGSPYSDSQLREAGTNRGSAVNAEEEYLPDDWQGEGDQKEQNESNNKDDAAHT